MQIKPTVEIKLRGRILSFTDYRLAEFLMSRRSSLKQVEFCLRCRAIECSIPFYDTVWLFVPGFHGLENIHCFLE